MSDSFFLYLAVITLWLVALGRAAAHHRPYDQYDPFERKRSKK